MTAKFTYEGLTCEAKHMKQVHDSGYKVYSVHLFKNNITPDYDTVLGDLTECDFTGYSYLILSGLVVAFDGGTHIASIKADDAVFTASGSGTPNTVYGYYVQQGDPAGTQRLMWAERFTTPLAFDDTGATVTVTPELDRRHG